MAYTKQEWVAREGVGLNKFKDSTTDQILILTSEPDSITVEGTPFTADRMNHMEDGIESAHEVIDNLGTVSTEDVVPLEKGGTNNSGLANAPDGAFIVKRVQTGDDTTTEFLGYTETIPFAKGGVSYDVRVNAPNNAIIKRLKNDTYDQLYYTPTKSGAFYATSENGAAVFGVLPLAQGGVGTNALTEAPAYAIIRKSGTSDNLWYEPTAAGVFQAEATNGAPKFDIVPVKFGGTGAANAASARTNLNAASLGANTFTGSQGVEDTANVGRGFYVNRTIDSQNYSASLYVSSVGASLVTHKTAGEIDNYIAVSDSAVTANSALVAKGKLSVTTGGIEITSSNSLIAATSSHGYRITRTIDSTDHEGKMYQDSTGRTILAHYTSGTLDGYIAINASTIGLNKELTAPSATITGSVVLSGITGTSTSLTGGTLTLLGVNSSNKVYKLTKPSMSYSSGTLTITW